MKTTSCKVAFIAVLAALSLAAGNAVAKPPAGPQIAASSCGGIPVPPSGNAFCSFEGTGAGAVIGQNSCNVVGACLLMGDGVHIGNNSCNGDSACTDTGTLNGVAASASSIIGNGSCNGVEACESAGSQGLSVIGNGSCNGGELACTGAGQFKGTSYIGNDACNNLNIGAVHNTCLFVASGGDDVGGGHVVVGNGSCNGSSACTFSGEFGASTSIGNNACNGLGACFDLAQGPFPGIGEDFQSAAVVGNGSCNADSACQFAGIAGSSTVGNTSCNNEFACEFAGTFNDGSTIGNHSCNGSPDLSDPDLPVGVCDSNEGVIGNNKRNSP
jgi:hypothetical protein